MKKYIILVFCMNLISFALAQEIIEIPHENKTEIVWEGGEKEYFSEIWKTQVITNVSVPTMQVFRPEKPNGTSVIVAPGGGLYALSIESEGNKAAKWLTKKGITAFVLKYRLVPTGKDRVKEITEEAKTNPAKLKERATPVLPLSIADGLSAISFVRENAQKLGIDPNKIGFMGFSAGGAVTMGVAYNYNKENRPDFLVPIYPWTTAVPVQDAPLWS
ncbi:Xylanase [hydrothermal vent metagenome]|uniref:Xylanase n=1 Tax=hydrothermal vent metagenome TaxID=652676 RepID=A0A3B0TH46_9ZZZZ